MEMSHKMRWPSITSGCRHSDEDASSWSLVMSSSSCTCLMVVGSRMVGMVMASTLERASATTLSSPLMCERVRQN